MSTEYKRKLAKSLFDMHVKQNKGNRKISIVDSLEFVSRQTGLNIFEVAKITGWEFYNKNKKKDQ
jgi:hypothetical protein